MSLGELFFGVAAWVIGTAFLVGAAATVGWPDAWGGWVMLGAVEGGFTLFLAAVVLA